MTELTGADPTEDWREHVEHPWTWPSSYGITGCVQCAVVFVPPSGDDAWTLAGTTLTVWSRT